MRGTPKELLFFMIAIAIAASLGGCGRQLDTKCTKVQPDGWVKRDFESRAARRNPPVDVAAIEELAANLDNRLGLNSGSSLQIANELVAKGAISSDQLPAAIEATAKVALTMHGDATRATYDVSEAALGVASGDTHALDNRFADLDGVQRENIMNATFTGHYSAAEKLLFEQLRNSIPDPPQSPNKPDC